MSILFKAVKNFNPRKCDFCQRTLVSGSPLVRFCGRCKKGSHLFHLKVTPTGEIVAYA